MPEQHDRSMQDLKPTVWIGKQGSTDTMIDEIVSQLKKRKLIKVKWLQSTEVDPESLAVQAKARLVEVRGRTMVLAEKGKGTMALPASPKVPGATRAKSVSKETAKTKGRSSALRSPAKAQAKDAPKADAVRKPRQTGSMKPRKR